MIAWWWLLVGIAVVGAAEVLVIAVVKYPLRQRGPVELRCRTRDGVCRYGACKTRGECLAAPARFELKGRG